MIITEIMISAAIMFLDDALVFIYIRQKYPRADGAGVLLFYFFCCPGSGAVRRERVVRLALIWNLLFLVFILTLMFWSW